MQTSFITFFLLLIFTAQAQLTDSVSYNKFHIGFTYAPELSYRILRTDEPDIWMKENFDTLEISKYGYTTGLNIIFSINKNLSLSSGLLFSDKGERTKKYAIQPVNNYVNHFYYLDIPLKVIYTIRHKKYYYSKPKKMNFYITGGFSVNVFLNSRTKTISGLENTEETLKNSFDLSRINFSFLAGCGMTAPITNRWYFKLEPLYRTSLNKVADSPVKKYFYSLGLNLGLFSKF
jgi:hypothetical protein